jgi:hypothetical protein
MAAIRSESELSLRGGSIESRKSHWRHTSVLLAPARSCPTLHRGWGRGGRAANPLVQSSALLWHNHAPAPRSHTEAQQRPQ